MIFCSNLKNNKRTAMRSKRGGENHILAERHPKTENFKNVDDKLHGEEERDGKQQRERALMQQSAC